MPDDFFALRTRSQLYDLHKYITDIETYLDTLAEGHDVLGDKNLSGFGLEQKFTLTMYAQVLRSAGFLAIYALFEHQLMSLCKEKQSQHELKLADLRHQGIELAKVYLNKVVGIAFPSDSIEWQTLKQIGRVRNLIAHQNGDLDEGKLSNDVREYAKQNTHIRAEEGSGTIYIERRFCSDVIGTMQRFLNKLAAVLPG